jgi:hypothetical protein
VPVGKETMVAQESTQLVALLSDLVNEYSRGDAEAVVGRFATGDEVLVIGTSSDEWLDDAKLIRDSFREEAGTLRAEFETWQVRAFEEGPVGWIAARGQVTLADGTVLPVRWTLVLHRVADRWEILHTHLSVPDDLDSPGGGADGPHH